MRTYYGPGDAAGLPARVEIFFSFVFRKYQQVIHVHDTDVPNEGPKSLVHHAYKVHSGVRQTLRRPGRLASCRRGGIKWLPAPP